MNTPFRTEAEILSIVRGFEARTLPKAQWTHEGHLVTSIWYHVNYSAYEAICLLRTGIAAYNEATGGKNTPQDGYHETLTLFWCKTINDFVDEHRGLPLADLCNLFLSSDQASKEYPFRFYDREVLLSLKARAVWVEPQRR